MRRTRSRMVLTLVTAAGLLGAVACSSGSDGGSGGSSASAGTSGSTDSGTTNATGSFSVAEIEPDHLTPGRAGTAYDEIHALFTSLAKVGTDNKVELLQAESITPSADNTVWTVKIRPGWTFHNGEPVTAQSYVDGMNTTAYGPNAWANSGELVNVKGYAALNPLKGTPKVKTLSGLKVVDATTFVVTLTKGDSQFALEMTPNQPAFYPLPKAALKNLKAYDEAPIGDGPYKMVGTWQHDKSISMTAFAGYQGVKPKTGNLVFKIYSDADTAYTDALADNVDIAFVPQDKFSQLDSDFPDHSIKFDAVALDYLGFPLWDKRWQNVKLREAVSMSIDRDAINTALFGGLFSPAKSTLSPSTIGGTDDSCGVYCTLDPVKAKALLAAAGGWSGPMTISFPGGLGYDATFEAVANQIRQNLGIATVRAVPDPTFAEFFQNLTDKKTANPYRGHWGSLYPSAQNLLTALFTPTGDGVAETGYSSAATSSLIDQANAAGSTDESIALYKKADKQIMTDFPIAPLFYGKYVYAYSNKVDHVRVTTDQIELGEVTVK